jgi:hypothetical protein
LTISFSELMSHYMVPRDAGIFFLVSFAAVVAVLSLIALYCRGRMAGKEHTQAALRERTQWTVERFAEILFSDTSMLAFISAYVMLDWFVVDPAARSFWASYSDFILLGLIILSCVLNSFLDRVFLPLKRIRPEEKASLRLVSMLYMFVIFLYIKFIYVDDNYDSIIVYFIGMMIGRFVFFGASLKEFLDAISHAARDLGMLALALLLTAFMAWYGFGTGYLLRINGVVVSLLIAHLYLIVALFILVRFGFVKLLVPVPKGEEAPRNAERDARLQAKRTRARERKMEDEWEEHDPFHQSPAPSRNAGRHAARPAEQEYHGENPAPEDVRQRSGRAPLRDGPSRQAPEAQARRQRRQGAPARRSRNFVDLEEEPDEIVFSQMPDESDDWEEEPDPRAKRSRREDTDSDDFFDA